MRLKFRQAASVVRAVPAFDELPRGKLDAFLPQRKIPGDIALARADFDRRLMHAIGKRHFIARRNFDIAAGDRFDHAEKSVLGGDFGEEFERDVVGFGEKPENRRPRAAAALQLPRPAAVLRGEDRSQRADGPAVLVVGKGRWHAAEADEPVAKGVPGPAGIGRMKDHGARRAGDPNLLSANGQRGEIEIFGGSFGQSAQRRMPGAARIVGRGHRAAVADEPASIARSQSHLAEIFQPENAFARRLDRARGDFAKRAVAAGQGGGAGIEKIAGQPAGTARPE